MINAAAKNMGNPGWECQVVQHTGVVPENFAPEIIDQFYVGGDFHRIYFGEILRTLAEEYFAG